MERERWRERKMERERLREEGGEKKIERGRETERPRDSERKIVADYSSRENKISLTWELISTRINRIRSRLILL